MLALASIVVVGTALVVASRGNVSVDRTRPILGDHWHVSYGVFDCTGLIPPFPDSMARSESGLHTHADGLIHMEVNGTRYSGKNANIRAFADGVGLEVSDDALEGPGVSRRRGDRCGEDPGVFQLAVWDSASDDSPTIITDDIADYAPQDGQLFTLAFAPAGSPIPKPSETGPPTTSPTDSTTPPPVSPDPTPSSSTP